jgi:DNA polymerase-3 subunit alpha
VSDFVHLHVRSHFTLLQSTITVKKLLGSVKKKGMDAVALTDRGNLFGAFEAWSEANDKPKAAKGDLKKAKETAEKKPDDAAVLEALAAAEAAYAKAKADAVQLIVGCEMAVTSMGMTERVRDSSQLVLLAQNENGYRNLSRLVSRGWLEGFYFEPRVDLEAIAALSQDLICLTGAGQWSFLNRHLVAGNREEAVRQLGRLKDIFGDRVYVELSDFGPDANLDWRGLVGQNVGIARELDVPVVATNWVHYLDRAGAPVHDVQLAAEGATTLADTKRKRMPTQEFYLKTADEMAALFADLPEAIANTRVIADRCATSGIPMDGYQLPKFPCPDGLDENQLLRKQCEEGLVFRYGDEITPAHRERLEFELDTIIRMGFPAYFLIVADFIGWAKDHGIPVGPGRGSAAGSLVAYAMKITDMCPLKYGLLFERFLNPGRKSMPDIDIDFCKDRRDEVIQYVKRKYGEDAVTNIMTLGTMKAKMAIKDSARAYEWTPEEAQQLANFIPTDPSGKTDIPVCLGLKPLDPKKNEFAIVEGLKARYDGEERTRTVLDAAMQLEGLGRSLGVHACGIIIAPGPVSSFVPVCKVKGEKAATQFNMTQVEKAGLLKMDFLGLKTMSILKKATEIVKATEGIDIDLLKIPLADPRTFALLGTGRTLGVFQCESRGFQELIARLKPDRFEDMIALVALYRPGPLMANMHIDYCDRKHGIQKVTYPHACVEGALKETYGLYIYQEQVMILSRELCGFSPSEADDLRKAMGKKDIKTLEKLKEKFIGGAWDKWQFDRNICGKMWESILGFASYCFNKSHSACYGLIAYWTAWFKANHYAAFMTANLIYEMGDKEKMTLFVEELKSDGIEVLPPDINESGWEFTVVRRGADLSGVRGPGSGVQSSDAQGVVQTPAGASADTRTPDPGPRTPDDTAKPCIRFGFGGVKAMGEGATRHLVEVRKVGGPFTGLYDVFERVDQRTINKRVAEAMVKVGAFDALHGNRRAVFDSLERAYDRGARVAKTKAQRQSTLFDTFEEDASFKAQTQGLVEVADWPMTERLRYEKELTGYWMSCHPVQVHREVVERFAWADAKTLPTLPKGSKVVIAAVITGKRSVKTKTGRFLAVLSCEDATAHFEAVLFPGRPNRRGQFEPGAYERFAAECEPDVVALFAGVVEHRERRANRPPPAEGEEEAGADPGAEDEEAGPVVPIEEPKVEIQISLQISDVIPMALVTQRLTKDITLALAADEPAKKPPLEKLELLLREHAGSCPLHIQVHLPEGVGLTVALGDRWKVRPSDELLARLAEIVGPERIILRSQDPFEAARQAG